MTVNYERDWIKGNWYAQHCIVINLQARFFKELSIQQLLSTSNSTPKGKAKIIKTSAGGLMLQEIQSSDLEMHLGSWVLGPDSYVQGWHILLGQLAY